MMETRILKVDPAMPDRETVLAAGRIIREGGLVAFPTETVYGLGGDALLSSASKKIYEAKGRPSDNPLIVHLGTKSVREMARYAAEIPEDAKKLAEALWPGPLTMVLPKRPEIPDATTGGLSTVGLRCPYPQAARRLIASSGTAIAAPSANLSGRPSPTTWQDVAEDMDGRIDAIITGARCRYGIESTVLDLTGSVPTILRPGWYPPYLIAHILGKDCVYDPALFAQPGEDYRPKAPGMKYKHYAPAAPVTILKGSFAQFCAYVDANKTDGTMALCFAGEEALLPVPAVAFGAEDDGAAQAAAIFSALREVDKRGAKAVFARFPQMDGVGLAVFNRLVRAAAFRVIDLGGAP